MRQVRKSRTIFFSRLAITDAIVNSLLLIPAFLISRYNLSRESLAKMQSELRLKRARDESSSNPPSVSMTLISRSNVTRRDH